MTDKDVERIVIGGRILEAKRIELVDIKEDSDLKKVMNELNIPKQDGRTIKALTRMKQLCEEKYDEMRKGLPLTEAEIDYTIGQKNEEIASLRKELEKTKKGWSREIAELRKQEKKAIAGEREKLVNYLKDRRGCPACANPEIKPHYCPCCKERIAVELDYDGLIEWLQKLRSGKEGT